ncbi:hypothetical protein R80B4_01796 [Fibrobacteres bacterium R8-0-B4]
MKTESLPAGRGPLDRRDPKRYNPLSSLLTRFRKGGKTGSAIVGVLAALVFIGIVVAAMVKNTGSQSAASIGYGTPLFMTSTSKSGVVATEAYFTRTDKANAMLTKIDDIFKNKDGTGAEAEAKKNPYIFGGPNNKIELGSGSGQFFSSKLIYHPSMFADGRMRSAKFLIESGKRSRGKTLDSTYAFYAVGNVKVEGKATWPGGNAMMMDMELQYSSGSITVEGNATFLKPVTTADNATGGIKFKKDKNGNGSVFFNNPAYLKGNVNFEVPAFFNNDAFLAPTGTGNMFDASVGFNKNVTTGTNSTVKVNGDVWTKGGFVYTESQGSNTAINSTYKFDQGTTVNIEGVGTGRTLRSTGLPTLTAENKFSGSQCEAMYPGLPDDRISTICFPFDTDVKTKSGVNIKGMDVQRADFSATGILNGLCMAEEAYFQQFAPTNPDAVADSRVADEPKIDTTNLKAKGKEILTLSQLGATSPITLDAVNGWYNKFPIDKFPQYYNEEGHLLVKINQNIKFANPTTSTFEKKIALIVDGASPTTAGIEGKFFNSGEKASTLIYVGKNAKLDNFGCQETFRGLIYMDENNGDWTAQPTFEWGPKSTIEGALLLKGTSRINWAAGHTTIRKNDEILSGFSDFIAAPNPPQKADGSCKSPFVCNKPCPETQYGTGDCTYSPCPCNNGGMCVKGAGSSEKKADLVDGTDHIGLTPLGYYYNPK